MQLDLELVTAALGARPRSLEPLCQGGYTRSLSWRVETSNGPAFVKQADDEGSLHMLRREALVYEHVRGPFLPGYFGFADAGCRAVLAIELLEEAYWPPPYPALCSDAWLERALPTLIAAERDAVSVGDDLVHNDVYSGNVSFVDDRAVLVDWGAAVKGSRWVDVAYAILSIRVEGGKLPPVDLSNEGSYASSLAGHFALEAATAARMDAGGFDAPQGHDRRPRARAPQAAEALELPLP